MANSRQSATIFSPSSKRPTKRTRSSITEHSFQGITSSPRGGSVTYVSGTNCHPCLRPLISFESRPAWSGLGIRLSLGQAGVIVRTHPCPSRLHWKYLKYVLFPQNRLDDWGLALHPRHLLRRVVVAEARLGAAFRLRQSRTVHPATPGQCRPTLECRHA